MHHVFYKLRRAFHTSNWFAIGHLAPMGITPARFDMLLYVHDGIVSQGELRNFLGVTAPTVSKMLKALERLLLVVRERDRDRRRRVIHLTAEGLRLVRLIIAGFIENGRAEKLVHAAYFASECSPGFAAYLLDRICAAITSTQWAFGDHSECPYLPEANDH